MMCVAIWHESGMPMLYVVFGGMGLAGGTYLIRFDEPAPHAMLLLEVGGRMFMDDIPA